MAKQHINVDDDLGLDIRPTRKSRASGTKKRVEYLGKLHELLSKGLPDLIDQNGILDVKKLAGHLGISFQAVYKFFKNDQIPTKRIPTILALSKTQKKGGENFKPLVRDDFWEFLSK